MAILVTGCSGFSGSVVAAKIAETGQSVIGLYRRRGSKFLEHCTNVENINLVQCDIADIANHPDLKGVEIECIVHVASTSPAPGITTLDIMHDNILAMHNLVNWAIEVKCPKFIYFSSISAFGTVSQPTLDETHSIVDPDPYGTSKLAAEQILQDVADVLPSVSIRLPGIIGPGAHRNWLSGVKTKLQNNEDVKIFHRDKPFNNAAHVVDLANLVKTLTGQDFSGADFFVVGADGQMTVYEAINFLKQEIGSTSRILENTDITSSSFKIDSSKAIKSFGYRPMHIKDMLNQFAHE